MLNLGLKPPYKREGLLVFNIKHTKGAKALLCSGLFTIFAYADVGCGVFDNSCWNCKARSGICETGKMGYIKVDEKLKAIKVEVVDTDTNQIVARAELKNPPGVFIDYTGSESVDRNDWVANQIKEQEGYTVGRKHRVVINPISGFVFDNNTVLYANHQATDKKGVLAESDIGPDSERETDPDYRWRCEYTDTPTVARSSLCPNDILCTAPILCRDNTKGYRMTGSAICRAKKNKKCPVPSQCMLDHTKHIYQQDTEAVNNDELMEYKSRGTEQENHPVYLKKQGSVK